MYTKIKLAETVIQIEHHYSELRFLCEDYLCDDDSELFIAVSHDDIDAERLRSDRNFTLQNMKPIEYSRPYLETLAAYRKIADELLEKNIILFHGSAVAVDGEVYLFTAKSGTGKSTHVRFWREQFGSRAVMVNDDKPLLKITEAGVTVYGTPWDGKHHLSSNIAMPLKALCILERAENNEIEAIASQEALPLLMQQSNRPTDAVKLMKTVQLVDQLSKKVNLYRLHCNMDPQAAHVAFEGMQ